MNTIRVGGVPEHFNFPWHWAKEQGWFEKVSIDLQWQDFPGGTGAMHQALKNNEVDLAIVLTEGAVAEICKGSPNRILQSYVTSPLTWGVHVSANTDYEDMNKMAGKKYAISREGSGSHLMAYVDAWQRGWKVSPEQFVIVNNLDGARKSLASGESHLFLWEKFTTQPLVDAGEFKRISESPTPWDCFVIVTKEDVLKEKKELIQKTLDVILQASREVKNNSNAIKLIAEKYQLRQEQVEEWFNQTTWATEKGVSQKDLTDVLNTLKVIGLISEKPAIDSLIEVL